MRHTKFFFLFARAMKSGAPPLGAIRLRALYKGYKNEEAARREWRKCKVCFDLRRKEDVWHLLRCR